MQKPVVLTLFSGQFTKTLFIWLSWSQTGLPMVNLFRIKVFKVACLSNLIARCISIWEFYNFTDVFNQSPIRYFVTFRYKSTQEDH
jgi:hypothetical protein